MRFIATLVVALSVCLPMVVQAADVPLRLEGKILLGDVSGRIDHLAVDLQRQRLFVAELGNNSVGVVDLNAKKTTRRITGFHEPQGIAFVTSDSTLYVASGGDGTLKLFQGAELTPAGKIDIGNEADNVRIDTTSNRIWIGYGTGALAAVDLVTHQRVATALLKDHPESFQLETGVANIFVNVPNEHEIAVVDRITNRQIASWPTQKLHANYPMTVDSSARQVWAVFRSPARLAAFAMDTGRVTATLDTCGDADDVFLDPHRSRIYISCGEGVIDVFELQHDVYGRIARIPTASGARTSLYVPELDKLFVAIRKSGREPAAIWVFRPQ